MSVFTKAKGAVGLQAFLAQVGIPVVKIGQGLRTEHCPDKACNERPAQGADRWKVSLRENNFWRCFSCGQSGDVIKAASLIWKVTQLEAAKQLVKQTHQVTAERMFETAMSDIAGQQDALEQVIDGLFGHIGCSPPVREALNRRGISDAVIDEAVAQGVLVGLSDEPGIAKAMLERACGKTALMTAGLWRENAMYPAMAFRPLLLRYGTTGLEARRINNDQIPQPGSPGAAESGATGGPLALRYGAAMAPFVLAGDPAHHCVTKSAIDAMSLRTLGHTGTIAGLPGDSSWRSADSSGLPNPGWFAHIQGVCEIAFSGSDESDLKAQQLAQSLQGVGIVAKVIPMPAGCDVNDMLISSMI